MSESTPETAPETPDFEPITSQEEFEKRLSGRLAREVKKYADYGELKEKASKLDELETAAAEANKTWEQKYHDLLAEKEAAELAAVRAEVAADKGVPANRLKGSTREELEADADELAALLGRDKKPKLPASGLKSGATGQDQRMDPKEKAANAIRSVFRS